MEATIIAQEFQRFFSLIFKEKEFSCLLLTPEGEKIILKNAIAPLQPEHKMWLARINFNSNGFTVLRENQQLHLKSPGKCGIAHFPCNQSDFYLVVPEEHFGAFSYIHILIAETLRQLENRKAASLLMARYEERIAELEEEKAKQQKLQTGILVSKIEVWKAGIHVPVEIDPNILEQKEHIYFQDELIKQLTKAVELQLFLQPGISSLRITPQMLPENEKGIATDPKQATWHRATILLDKYEEAAAIVRQAGLTVNGKTIAQFLAPPVSPPAITDALKKNRKGIMILLRENQGKWPLLRKNLKQVRELHENGNLFMRDPF